MIPPKYCPECRTEAKLDAGYCRVCGHLYRTQFVHGAPLPESPRVPSPPPPRGRRAARKGRVGPGIVGAFLGFCVLWGMAVHTLEAHRPLAGAPVAPASSPASGVGDPQEAQTLLLYCSTRQTVATLGAAADVHPGANPDGSATGFETWHYFMAGGGDLFLTFRNGAICRILQTDGTGGTVRLERSPESPV